MSYVISESNFSQLVIEAVGPAAITNVTALSICCVGGCLKGNLVLSKPETMEHSSADYETFRLSCSTAVHGYISASELDFSVFICVAIFLSCVLKQYCLKTIEKPPQLK